MLEFAVSISVCIYCNIDKNLNHCALCETKFISRNYSKIHSKINPYHCTMCGKDLISRNNTKRHMKSLARENLYQVNILLSTESVEGT